MIIRTRIIVIISAVLLIAIAASTVIALNLQSKKIISSKLSDVEVISNIIMHSIERAMAKGQTDEVQAILENIGSAPEIQNLRIISSDGYILKSKSPAEIGGKSREFLLMSKNDDRYRPIVDRQRINHMTPIPNKAQCHACHSADIAVNGIIEITYDMSRSMQDILSVKRFLVVSNILTILVVAVILGAVVTFVVLRPLKSFLETIKAVESGNLDARVDISRGDEFGIISASFNSMLDELKTLYDKGIKREKEISRVKVELDHKVMLEELNAQLQYKVKEVETANKTVLSLSKEVKAKNIELEKIVDRLKKLNDMGRVLTSIIDTDELIKIVIRTTCELFGVERGSVKIMRNHNSSLVLTYQFGIGIIRDEAGGESTVFGPFHEELVDHGKVVISNHASGKRSSVLGIPLKMKGQIIGCMLLENRVDGGLFTQDDAELLSAVGNQTVVAIENAWLYETVKSNYFGTIQSLVNALEASDRYTRGHSERVKFLGTEMCRMLGLDFREVEAFTHAAILHDIGKIGIDSSILNKEDELTPSEFSLIRAHPVIGDEILGPIGTLEGVRMTILQHHEKFDGSGYPYGISGEEITLKARILSVIDTFDAMVTDRPYRRALPFDIAVEEIRSGGGTQFDPLVVEAFLELVTNKREVLMEAGYTLR